MLIFETIEIEITNKKTGKKKTQLRRQVAGARCDYSGRLIDDYSHSYCSYICDYSSQDSCFGSSGEEYILGKVHNIDMHAFMSQPYEFYDDTHMGGEFGNEEANMMREMVGLKIGDGSEDSFPTLESAFRCFRIRTAKKLIDQGVIHPDDLKEEL